jgi:hypothetical protein
LRTDPGCLDGIFVPTDCVDISLALDIPSAGTYEIASVGCIGAVTIKVLASDGTTALATSPPGTEPSCSAVTHTFDAAGSFRLLLEKRNLAGCAAGAPGGAGDFYVRVSPKP